MGASTGSQTEKPTTPAEIRELAEELPEGSTVSCMDCGEEWLEATQFVESSLRALRELLEEMEEAGETDDNHIRYGISKVADTAHSLLGNPGYERLSVCGGCAACRQREGRVPNRWY